MSYHTCVSMEEPGAGEGSMLWLCLQPWEVHTKQHVDCTPTASQCGQKSPAAPQLWPRLVHRNALISRGRWDRHVFGYSFALWTDLAFSSTPSRLTQWNLQKKKSPGPPEPLKSRSHGYMLGDFFFWLSEIKEKRIAEQLWVCVTLRESGDRCIDLNFKTVNGIGNRHLWYLILVMLLLQFLF